MTFFQAIFILSSHYHVFYPAEYNIFRPLTKPGSDRIGSDRIGSDRTGLTKPGSGRILLNKPISTH